MKRDLDLIRDILLHVEAIDPEEPYIMEWEGFEGYTDLEVHEHVKLLIDSGYVEGGYSKSSARHISHVEANRLTMEGHDFLDDMRNDTVWKKTKTKIRETTGSASLAVVKQVAQTLAQAMVMGG